MAYVKNIWVDQDVERPKTYEVTNNQDGSITLTDSFGLVTELGTPVNEVNMNHIEDGIDGCAIRKHNLTEIFNLGEWVLGGTGDDEGIYKSLIANNVGNAISDDTAWEKVELGGGGYEVGDIVIRNTPTNDAGKHLLDGSLLQYGIYKEFIDYIADLYAENPSANYFTTEALWQQSVTTYGSCGKFVYNATNNTVRLPKVSDILQGTTDISALGDLVEAGLPNLSYVIDSHGNNSTTGTPGLAASGTMNWHGVKQNANIQNSIYGNSSTVQPQTIKVLYYIVIANSTKTDIQVDIDEIATDLNGKADVDLTNVNNSGTSLGAGWAMPSSTYIDLTLGASGSTYTAPANGWIILGASTTNGYIAMTSSKNNMTTVSQHSGGCNVYLPVIKGDIITINYGGTINSWPYFRFVYAQGSESEAS